MLCVEYSQSPIQCEKNRCHWNWDVNTCGTTKIRCEDVTKATSCDAFNGCSWRLTSGKCGAAVNCTVFSTPASCTESSCTWNDKAEPRCFRHGDVPCEQITTIDNCNVRGCLWAFGGCYPSDASFCRFAPEETLCYSYGSCFFDFDTKACYDSSMLPQTQQPIAGTLYPRVNPSPGEPFEVRLYGKALHAGDKVLGALRRTTFSCPEANNHTAWAVKTSGAVELRDYDATKRSYSVSVTLPMFGEYSLCVLMSSSGSVALVPKNIFVQRIPPAVSAVAFSESYIYADEVFTVFLEGNLFKDTGVIFVTAEGNEVTGCPSEQNARYMRVATATGTSASVQYKLKSSPHPYWLCITDYVFPVVNTSFQISVATVAPWKNPIVIRAKLEKFFGGDLAKSCSVPAHERLRLHPTVMDVQYGSQDKNYPTNDVCVYLLQPMVSYEAVVFASWGNVIQLTIQSVFLDDGDELRIFMPLWDGHTKCTSIPDSSACVRRGCMWLNGMCDAQMSSALTSCPTAIDGFYVQSVFTYQSFSEAAKPSGSVVIGIPYPSAALLVVCTDKVRGTGTGVIAQYAVRTSMCLNDCKDEEGNVNGQCITKPGELQGTCKCSAAFQGEDCRQRYSCLGVNSKALTFTKPAGSHFVNVREKSHCGFALVPNPTDDKSLSRMTSFYLAIQLVDIALSGDGDLSCDSSYIRVREGDYDGATLYKACPKTKTTTWDTPVIFTSTDKAYIHFSATSARHSFILKWKIVSKVCPGPVKIGSYPLSEDECDGNGKCVDAARNTDRIEDVSYYGKVCRCKEAYASLDATSSCNVCAFGKRQDTYPKCEDATSCVECKNGVCIGGLCKCKKEFYGTRCEERVPESTFFEDEATLRLRYSFDAHTAANTASNEPDTSTMPCQQSGSKFPCITTPRNVGLRYVAIDQFGDQESNLTLKNRRLLTSNKTEDTAIILNNIVVNNVYREMIRAMPIRGTPLDVSTEISVSAWIKVTNTVNGFLVAKVDAAFTSAGTHPALERALHDVQNRWMSDGDLRLGKDALGVYFAIHLNGPKQMVTILQSKGKDEKDSSKRDNWHVVRHFRLSSHPDLFNNTWRLIAVTAGWASGLYQAKIYIDGVSVPGSAQYAQCLPWPPQPVKRITNTTYSEPGVTLHSGDGALITGYHFQGAIDELRIYSSQMNLFTVISIGGPQLSFLLNINVRTIYSCAFCVIAALVVALAFPSFRNIRRKFFGSEKKEEKYAMDVPNEAPESNNEAPKKLNRAQAVFFFFAELIRDTLQTFVLFYESFTFPESFTQWFGKVAPYISLDFATILRFDIVIVFYVGVAIIFVCFITLLYVVVSEKQKSRTEILNDRIAFDEGRRDSVRQKYMPEDSKVKLIITFLSIFTMSTLYIPITKLSFQIITCHSSVQCAFECYHEDRFWVAFYTAAVMVGVVSVGFPIFVTVIIYLKRREFLNFIGEEAASKPETIDTAWKEYVSLDCSRFNFLYSFFEYNWAFFTVINMMIKALSILCTLIVPPDSPEQMIGAIVVQGAFTVLVFMTAPFILDSYDIILQAGQAFVMCSLAMVCFSKVNPTKQEFGIILTISMAMIFFSQLSMVVLNWWNETRLNKVLGGGWNQHREALEDLHDPPPPPPPVPSQGNGGIERQGEELPLPRDRRSDGLQVEDL